MLDEVALIHLLETEKEKLAELAKVCLAESKAIVNHDLTRLQISFQEKESLKGKMEEIEINRKSLVGEARLLELLPRLSSSAQVKIKKLHMELKAGVREVQALNHTNRMLFEYHRSLFEQIQAALGINLLAPYDQSGRLESNNRSGNFVSRLA